MTPLLLGAVWQGKAEMEGDMINMLWKTEGLLL